jgi:hypothetical protein
MSAPATPREQIERFFHDLPLCAAAGCDRPAYQGGDLIPASAFCVRHLAAMALSTIRQDTSNE